VYGTHTEFYKYFVFDSRVKILILYSSLPYLIAHEYGNWGLYRRISRFLCRESTACRHQQRTQIAVHLEYGRKLPIVDSYSWEKLLRSGGHQKQRQRQCCRSAGDKTKRGRHEAGSRTA